MRIVTIIMINKWCLIHTREWERRGHLGLDQVIRVHVHINNATFWPFHVRTPHVVWIWCTSVSFHPIHHSSTFCICPQLRITNPIPRFVPNDVSTNYLTILGISSTPGILTRLLVVLRPYFFSLLDRDVLSPEAVITLANQNYLNRSGVHHKYYRGCCQRGFVSSELW